MNVVIDTRNVQRHDTEANWNSKNPVLLAGEIGIVTDGEHVGMTKTGNSIHPWKQLPFDKAIAEGGNADTVSGHTVADNVPFDLNTKLNKALYVDNVPSSKIVETKTATGEIVYPKTKLSAIEDLKDGIKAEIVTVAPITDLTSANVQDALDELNTKISSAGGTVQSVNDILPDENKNITLTAKDISGIPTNLTDVVFKSNTGEIEPSPPILKDSDLLDGRDKSYYQNVSGLYSAICTFSTNFLLLLEDTSISIQKNIFTLVFVSPSDYVSGKFIFDGIEYVPTEIDFKQGKITYITFDKINKKCYPIYGNSIVGGKAVDIILEPILGLESNNVQNGFIEFVTELDNKVDKIEGKQLSTNDYTTLEKNKLGTLQNTIINNTLIGTSITEALSANQGKVLKDLVNTKQPSGDYATTSALNTKAPLSSPALTGTPTAPTAPVETNNTQIATTAFVQTAIGGFAPETIPGKIVVGTTTSGHTTSMCDFLCDGTDDQAEINAAIQALPVGGGEVHILAGTYNIFAGILMNRDNVMISGNGASTILKRMWQQSLKYEGIIAILNQYCTVQNLKTDGNSNQFDSNKTCSILISSSYATVKSNYCAYARHSIALYTTGSISNISIADNCIYDNRQSSGISTPGSTDSDDIKNITITGNIISNCYYGIYLDYTDSVTISGNTISECSIGIDTYHITNCNITGNVSNNNSDTGIYLGTGAKSNSITGNVVMNNGVGILIAARRTTCVGNTVFRGEGLPSDYTASQHTIRIYSSLDGLIAENIIMGKNYVADVSTNTLFVNNKFN